MVNWIIKQTADLGNGINVKNEWEKGIMPLAYPGDDEGHVWQITVTQNGNPVDLTGHTVTAYFFREYDSESVPVTGEVVGAVASVTFAKKVYAYPCRVTGIMRLTSGGKTVTIGAISFHVGENLTDTIIDPGEVIPGIDDLLEQIETMEENNAEFEAIRDEITEPSRNLFWFTNTTDRTYRDAELVFIDSSTVKINRTATSSEVGVLYALGATTSSQYKLAAGTYICNVELVSGTASANPDIRYYDENHTTGSGSGITNDTETELENNACIIVRLPANATYTDAIYRFTLEAGDTLHPWISHNRVAIDSTARSDIDTINGIIAPMPDIQTGWNLFVPTDTSASARYNGVTVSVDQTDPSIITLDGTTNANMRVFLRGCTARNDHSIKAGTIIYTRELLSGTSGTLRLCYADDTHSDTRINIGEAVEIKSDYSLYLYAGNGVTFTQAKYKFLLEEGTVLHEVHISASKKTAFDGWSRDNINAILTKDDLPEYYTEEYLEERIAAIRSHIDGASVNLRGDMFAFITDPHFWNTGNDGTGHAVQNGFQSVKLIKLLMEKVNLPFVINGGDLHSGSSASADTARELLAEARAYYAPIWDHMYSILGNHDWNINADGRLSLAEIYSELVKDKEPRFGAISSRGDYWFDNAVQKIRYFCIGCNETSGMLDAQVTWFGDQLKETPSGYTVIVITHAACQGSGGLHLNTTFENYLKLMDAANAKQSITLSIRVAPFDYTSLNDVVVAAVLSGHAHTDGDLASEGGIPVIATTCDFCDGNTLNDQGQTIERSLGTKYEHAFDVVQIDLREEKIYTTRIGASMLSVKDREFDFPVYRYEHNS